MSPTLEELALTWLDRGYDVDDIISHLPQADPHELRDLLEGENV